VRNHHDKIQGLSAAEARVRLVQFSPNELTSARRLNSLRQFLSFFSNPLVIILLMASMISAFAGEPVNVATGDLHHSHGGEPLAQPSEQIAYDHHAARGRHRHGVALYSARQTAGLHAGASLVLRVSGRGDEDIPTACGISQAPPDAQNVAT
jgi:hypothetical protein